MIEALGISLLAAGVALWLLLRSTRHAAKEEIKREVAEELLDDVYTAKQIRDHIDRNPDGRMAKLLRSKYQRK